MSSADVVGVVIPAYNAERTLDETLRSVRAQTHRTLEIVVVDDGSSDTTAAVAQRHADRDPRVRLLRQSNAGVAAARNAGWRSLQTPFIAFVDADDLWAPSKIERQLAALRARGPRAGLAYCWTVRVDMDGRITHLLGNPAYEGEVFDRILRTNFIGSGSAALVRREVLEATGGFDSSLRAGGGEGCEDWLFYARTAAQWDYALAPDVLLGYRRVPGAMSSHRLGMLLSHRLMCRALIAAHPERAHAIRAGLGGFAVWLMDDARRTQGWRAAWRILASLGDEPRIALPILLWHLPRNLLGLRSRLRALLRRRSPAPISRPSGRRFLATEGSVDE